MNPSSPLLPNPLICLNKFIGNTPLIKITFKYKGNIRCIYAKYEVNNLTGSIKDRMAYYIIRESYKDGSLKPGDEIVEATSGNTGIAFASIGNSLGHKVTIYMPDWMSKERIDLIKSYGANIRLVSKEEGGFLGSIAMANAYAKENDNVFRPQQFDNEYNPKSHYDSTGPEIISQLGNHNLSIDAFVAGVGTGGTIMGIGKYLREKQPRVKLFPLEPSNSPTMSTGHKVGKHRIQGISDEFIPSIVKLDELDDILGVDDGDAIVMTQKLIKTFGIGLGISSGANFLGALMAQNKIHEKATVVTVFCDSNKKYLSTDLATEESIKSNFLSSNIELVSLDVLD